jgi:hypothetical protein
MFDWIIEADIARLDRALDETRDDRERDQLRKLRASKLAVLKTRQIVPEDRWLAS